MLKNRCNPLNLDDFSSLEQERRSLLQQTETLKAQKKFKVELKPYSMVMYEYQL